MLQLLLWVVQTSSWSLPVRCKLLWLSSWQEGVLPVQLLLLLCQQLKLQHSNQQQQQQD